MSRRRLGGWIVTAAAGALAGCVVEQKPATVAPRPGPTASAAVRPPSPVISAPQRPAFEVSPEALTVAVDDAGFQLLAGTPGGGRDLTSVVRWRVEPEEVVEVDASGYLHPLSPGAAVVKASFEGAERVVKVTVTPHEPGRSDFAQDVVPVLTRSGCNTGACHGRLEGQNGFKLSLFGYDPAGGLPGRHPRRRRPSALAARPRAQPLPRKSDRPDGPRRRASGAGRLARAPDLARLAQAGRAGVGREVEGGP